jgi:hypothetical protein
VLRKFLFPLYVVAKISPYVRVIAYDIAFTYRFSTSDLGVFWCCMNDTKPSCSACLSHEAKAKTTVAAHSPSEKNEMLFGEDGRCFHCGKSGLVLYYMIPESIESAQLAVHAQTASPTSTG